MTPSNAANPEAALHWQIATFDALDTRQLYRLLQLRSAVFVLEQVCAFQDIDGADLPALHVMGMMNDRVGAYARCLPAGACHAEASIGRVVVEAHLRGAGVGHALVRRAIGALEQHWGPQAIRISAQLPLTTFYRSHGFEACGAPYLEDGIAHIAMLRPIRAAGTAGPAAQTGSRAKTS